MASPDIELRKYITSEFSELLKGPNIHEEIDSALTEDNRTGVIIERLKEIAGK